MRTKNAIQCLSAAIVVGILAVGPQAARATDAKDLVKLVPADAWGFVVIKSLDNLDAKVQILQKKMLPIPSPKDMITGLLNLGDTLDSAGAIGVVALDYNEFSDELVVFMIPAKDPKALLAKFEAGEPTEGIYECTIVEETMYAALKGDVVLLSPNKAATTKVLKAKKTLGSTISPARADAMAESDLYVSLSLGVIVTGFEDQIAGIAMMMGGAMGGGDTNPLDAIVKMFAQVRCFDIAIAIDDKGLSVAVLTVGKEGSDLEKMVGAVTNSSESMLSWLPKERFLFASGGTDLYSEAQDEFGGESYVLGMLGSMSPPGVDADSLKNIVKDWYALLKKSDRYAFGASVLAGGSGGMIGVTAAIETEDAAEFVKGVRAMYENAWDVSEDDDVEELKKVIVHAPDAATIDGSKVDTITIDLSSISEEVDEEWVDQLHEVLGKDLILRFGAIDSKRVIFTFGGGEERYKAVAKAVKAGSGALAGDEGIKSVSARLPSPRAAETYFAVDTILKTAKAIAKIVGEGDDIPDIPDVNAPIAMTSARLGKVLRGDLYVPMELIDAGVKIFQAQMMMGAMNDFDEDEDEDEKEGENEKENETEKEEEGGGGR